MVKKETRAEYWGESDVLVDVPQHHEVSDVLLPVEFALGEVSGGLALADLVVDLYRSCS